MWESVVRGEHSVLRWSLVIFIGGASLAGVVLRDRGVILGFCAFVECAFLHFFVH